MRDTDKPRGREVSRRGTAKLLVGTRPKARTSSSLLEKGPEISDECEFATSELALIQDQLADLECSSFIGNYERINFAEYY